jgi:phosphoribosylformylglycinamidine cyclo-ligase
VHALAHITGGGLTDNIPRVLRPGIEVVLQRSAWPRPAVFEWLANTGHIAEAEMHRTFNCGIGMIAIVEQQRAAEAIRLLEEHGEAAWLIGEVRHGDRQVVIESDR